MPSSSPLHRVLRPVLQPASRWLLQDNRRYETWVYEAIIVGALLVITAAATTPWNILGSLSWDDARFVLANWIAVFGVLGSFLQAQVGFRMAEAQLTQENPSVHCHRWTSRYWITKEVAWALVFLLTGAYSALLGNIIFMIYPSWRSLHIANRREVRKSGKS